MADMISNTHVGSANFKDNAKTHIGNVVNIHQTEDRCLSDLRITDPRDDKTRIEATKGGLFEDSYRWILEHSDFRQWRDDEQSRLLWIKGDPGKGKTMLLCGIINELTPQTRLEDAEANTMLSYFFCQAADERINSATAVLRGLIYLIVEQQPSLVSHIQKKYKHGGEAIFKDVNAWSALSAIFLNILEDASLKQTYILIDALDECVTDLPKLLDFVRMKSALFSHVKWIVSSRNWPDIEERLDSATQQMKLCLELNEKSISAAVAVYIDHQVDQMAQKMKYNDETKDAVHRHLSSNSNDTFLWVALVCQNLEKISPKNIIQKLNEFPPGLHALYERMVKQIHQLADVSDTMFCCQILATVLLVYRPITLAELGSLVKSPEDEFLDSESIKKTIGLCGSFLTVRDSQIYVIHQSAKDYLGDKAVSTAFFPSPSDVHAAIFSRSIQAMSAKLRRNIYNLCSPGLSSKEIKAPDPDPLTTIRYSCIHWVDHFCDIHLGQSQNQIDDEKFQAVIIFLRKYFLYWLEALGLIGHIEDGVHSMARLEDTLERKMLDNGTREPVQNLERFHLFKLRLKSLLRVKSSGLQSLNHQLLELAQDSRRFIRHNSSLIADSPLQVYTSALIFSPLNSLIRKIYKGEEPQWLKVKPNVEHDWRPYLQTLEGHSGSVRSICFSANGHYLASGSDDKTIKIWDAVTGKERQTLEGHSGPVWSIAFSADYHYLASGSDDKTIKIWDTTTGKEQQTFKGHNGPVLSISFSEDGHSLVSESTDETINTQDPKTEKEQHTLMSHNGWIQSVAFSANRRYPASGSGEGTIKIWDITTGKEQQTIKVHNDSVRSVALSADDRCIASESIYDTIKFRDKTGKERTVPFLYSDFTYPLAYSANTRYIALGTEHGRIFIWDITASKRHQSFVGHSAPVRSVAFSANGHYLASGSDDNTIKIWDITGKKKETPMDDTSQVQSLAFSADGHYFASGSWDKTIKIWDTTTGKKRQTLKVNTLINTMSFDATTSYLYTDIGPIKLDAKYRTEAHSMMLLHNLQRDSNPAQDQDQRRENVNNPQKANRVGYGLSTDKCWITWNKQSILWLPPEYQPTIMDIWPKTLGFTSPQGLSTDVIMAVCTNSGRVLVIRMSGAGPYPSL